MLSYFCIRSCYFNRKVQYLIFIKMLLRFLFLFISDSIFLSPSLMCEQNFFSFTFFIQFYFFFAFVVSLLPYAACQILLLNINEQISMKQKARKIQKEIFSHTCWDFFFCFLVVQQFMKEF